MARARRFQSPIGLFCVRRIDLAGPAHLTIRWAICQEHGEKANDEHGITVSERAARRIGEILKASRAAPCCASASKAAAARDFNTNLTWSAPKPPTILSSTTTAHVVLIDPVSVNYMAGSEIDFVDDLIGASFKVKNPKANASCGCGTSFAL